MSLVCVNQRSYVASINSNNSALKLLTHYHYQSNISSCQLWETFDCSWWQFASCLSWLLCINIPPSKPPRAPSLTYSLHQPDFCYSFRGFLISHCRRCWLCLLMCKGSICQPRGRLGDKHQSFLTLDAGLVWLSSCPAGHNRMWYKQDNTNHGDYCCFMVFVFVSVLKKLLRRRLTSLHILKSPFRRILGRFMPEHILLHDWSLCL